MSEDVKSLVLILGAGASKEVKLPLGAELKQQIARTLDIRFEAGFRQNSGDHLVAEAFRALSTNAAGRPGDINPFLHAAWRIRDAMPQAISIDNFIDSHSEDERVAVCGKLAIARCILEAEARSSLRVDRSNINNKINFGSVESTWFNAFFQLLTENCQKANLPARLKKVAIISFNYDRCIEHYLHSALQNYYGMTSEAAANALTSLAIHHPYGAVGTLPWAGTGQGIEFGETVHARQLVALMSQLRTFTEGTQTDTSDVGAIRSTMLNAERVAFLGFAFHRLNLELLLGDSNASKSMRANHVYATALGLSNSDAGLIAQDLAKVGGHEIGDIQIRTDLSCSQLFQEYWRSLSLV